MIIMTTEQWLGLITGILFGWFLQKSRVLRFDKQIGALLLQDMTLIKVMLSAVLVGMVGILGLTELGMISFGHKPMNVGAILIGGALFGTGWAIAGFCPGTAIGAVGEGRLHALFAIAGMIVGAAIFSRLSPLLQKTVLDWQNYGSIGLPATLGVSPWLVVAGFSAMTIVLFLWFERKGL